MAASTLFRHANEIPVRPAPGSQDCWLDTWHIVYLLHSPVVTSENAPEVALQPTGLRKPCRISSVWNASVRSNTQAGRTKS